MDIEEADKAVRRVPLPNQMPKGLDFSELPVGTLKSSTLESLINQNEDLMARLTISLRRTNEYEDKVAALETENANLRSRFETLKEQYLLTQEKDRISTSRQVQLHEDNQSTKKSLAKLEKAYADLFVQAQSFQSQVIKLERNQARIRRAARSLQKNAKQTPQLRRELDETVLMHQQSVQSYEVKLADVRSEIESMRGKVNERDALYAEKIKVDNQLVYEQRQGAIAREEAHNRIDNLTAETVSLRVQLKEALVASEAKSQEIQSMQNEIPYLRTERQNLTEQVESLQALWSHKQKEIEGLEEKNKSLQKLNQSISLTLNQQRKQIHTLEQEMERERFKSSEKMKTLLDEMKMLREQLKERQE